MVVFLIDLKFNNLPLGFFILIFNSDIDIDGIKFFLYSTLDLFNNFLYLPKSISNVNNAKALLIFLFNDL